MRNEVKDIKKDITEETTDQPEIQMSKGSDDSWVGGALLILLGLVVLVVGSCTAIMDNRIEAINKGFAMRDEALNLALSNFCPAHADEISRALGVEPLPARPDIATSVQ
jgi:hypothetical protein